MHEGERGDMPFILVFIVYPALEVPFASVFRAGVVGFRVGGVLVAGGGGGLLA